MKFSSLLFALAVTAACGDSNNTKCGDGTMKANDTCVATPGPVCGDGTMLDNGMCVLSTPPTTCGPGTTLQNMVCVVDTTAPGPVTGLAATISGTSINLTWTAGSSSAQTLVARLKSGAYDAPAAGVTYTAGMTLPGGATVVAVGAGTTGTDTITTPGRYSYMAWSQNASGNYGFGREVSVASLPAQTGTLVIDVAATTATVMTQPANIALAGANVAYDGASSTLTFDLSATNNTAGQLYSTKAIFGTPSVGTIGAPSGTTSTGDPFLSLGFAASVPGDASTNTVTITGVGATDTVTLPVTIAESGLSISSANAVDPSGSASTVLMLPSVQNHKGTIFSDGFFDPSGRYFYGLTRWTTGFYRVDTNTGDVSASSPVTAGSGNGACMKLGADGYAYIAYGLGSHRYQEQNAIAIAKVDPATMTTVATATVYPPATAIRGRACALSGSKFAVSWETFVYFVDLATMKFVDVDTATADIVDPVDTATTDRIHAMAFSNDGATLYATATKTDLNIYAVNTLTYAVSTYHTATSSRAYALTVDSAGTMWWGGDDGLYSFDGTTETKVPTFTGAVTGFGPRSGNLQYVQSTTGTTVVDVTTGTATNTGTFTNTQRPGHSLATFGTFN